MGETILFIIYLIMAVMIAGYFEKARIYKDLKNRWEKMYFDMKEHLKKESESTNQQESNVEHSISHSVINWVAIKDKLPPKYTYIITYNNEGEQDIIFVHDPNKLMGVANGYTHWSNLPKPPCL